MSKIEDFKTANKVAGGQEEESKTDYAKEGKVVHKLKLQLESINISNNENSNKSKP